MADERVAGSRPAEEEPKTWRTTQQTPAAVSSPADSCGAAALLIVKTS